jgi:hypothetical protein
MKQSFVRWDRGWDMVWIWERIEREKGRERRREGIRDRVGGIAPVLLWGRRP